MSDSTLRRQVAQLAAELARTQAEVHTLRRGARRPQLGHSSIDSGSLDVVDSETGQVRLRLGYQPDGTVGVVPEGGDPHPAPAVPVVEPIPSGLSVSWDGSLSGLDTLPADFDHVNVHVSLADGFTPSGATFVGTITRSGGALPVAPLEVGTTYYVRLVPIGTGGVQGAPSPQASGVPAPVGGVPGPGSITETEIADDAISTPKLQAEAVTALKIAAQAIEAGHIQAAAITASKLEADLVLGTRIIAGDPSGARVELDENGLRGYDADDALVFAITDTGDAVFSGDITGSVISGSRFTMGTAPVTGVIEAVGSEVTQRVSSGPRQARLFATPEQAAFTAVVDATDSSTPLAGFSATSESVNFVVDSSRAVADGAPSITGAAFPDSSQLVLWSSRNTLDAPYIGLAALPGEVLGLWSAGDGSAVRLRAGQASASVLLTPPPASDPEDRQGDGYIFANRSPSDDVAAVSLQSPRWDEEGHPAHLRRSVIFAEGATASRPYTRITQAARRVLIMGEATGGAYDTTSDGMLDVASTHSIRAPRHHTVRTDMVSLPTQPSPPSGAPFVDFTSAQMPPVTFKTSWSGRTRIIIQMCGINWRTNAATISLGFRLSGAGTVPAALVRAAMARSAGTTMTAGRPAFQVVDLDLIGNSTYTLTPAWRISGSNAPWPSDDPEVDARQLFDLAYQNSIIVEPLL